MNKPDDYDDVDEDDDLGPRQWALFVVVGIPIIGLLAVIRFMVLEDNPPGEAIGVAIIVMAVAFVATVVHLLIRMLRHRGGR